MKQQYAEKSQMNYYNNLIKEGKFFRNPNKTVRSSSAGINIFAIKQREQKQDYSSYLNYLRTVIVPYEDGRQYSKKCGDRENHFSEHVNDCLRNLYQNKSGTVFLEAHIREILRILPATPLLLERLEFYWKLTVKK